MTPNLKSSWINKPRIKRGHRIGQFTKKKLFDKMEKAQKALSDMRLRNSMPSEEVSIAFYLKHIHKKYSLS